LQLTEIYGARFINLYGEKDSGVWYQALHDLADDDVRFGLYEMLRDIRFETWPPNCTQFRHLCLNRPEAAGLPDVHKAFKEAQHNVNFSLKTWSHSAVKFTVKYLTPENVVAARVDFAFAQFSALYSKVCARIRLGHQIPWVDDEDVTIKHKPRSNNIPQLSKLLR
jgi:hypothetical protein